MRTVGSILIIGLGLTTIVSRRRFAKIEAGINKLLTGAERTPAKIRLFEWAVATAGLVIAVMTTLYLFRLTE